MKISEAEDLIKGAVTNTIPETWADLGCGAGTFTRALHNLLPNNSKIFAVDKVLQNFIDINIEFLQSDFVNDPLPFNQLNGILMANSLHYVENKIAFLNRITPLLVTGGKLIIVEYDLFQPNTWVPYPVTFKQLCELLSESGFTGTIKMGEKSSIYNSTNIYAAISFF